MNRKEEIWQEVILKMNENEDPKAWKVIVFIRYENGGLGDSKVAVEDEIWENRASGEENNVD